MSENKEMDAEGPEKQTTTGDQQPAQPMPDSQQPRQQPEAADRGPAVAMKMDQPAPKPELPATIDTDAEVERRMRQMSRRSFLWSAAAAATGYAGWHWLRTRRDDNGIPWPLRRALETNEQLARDYFKTSRLAPTFPQAMAAEPKPNGDLGLSEDFDPLTWQLRVEGLAESSEPFLLTLDDIKALPRVEMVTELKCIEGWSQVVHWTGTRLADFMAKYPPETRSGDPPDVQNNPENLVRYAYLETPDGEYYVGLDMASGLQPQTLLCYEMNGEPLTLEHGAPLRLVIPVKYGIKNIKRIGTIRFTDVRPTDYWAERGYDWYAGH